MSQTVSLPEGNPWAAGSNAGFPGDRRYPPAFSTPTMIFCCDFNKDLLQSTENIGPFQSGNMNVFHGISWAEFI